MDHIAADPSEPDNDLPAALRKELRAGPAVDLLRRLPGELPAQVQRGGQPELLGERELVRVEQHGIEHPAGCQPDCDALAHLAVGETVILMTPPFDPY